MNARYGELSPTRVAGDLGLQRTHREQPWSWKQCLDAAVERYWERRDERPAA